MEIFWGILGLAKDNPDLMKDLFKLGVCFVLVRKEMGKHFDGLKQEIMNLTSAFKNLETKHDQRITILEGDVKVLKGNQPAK